MDLCLICFNVMRQNFDRWRVRWGGGEFRKRIFHFISNGIFRFDKTQIYVQLKLYHIIHATITQKRTSKK